MLAERAGRTERRLDSRPVNGKMVCAASIGGRVRGRRRGARQGLNCHLWLAREPGVYGKIPHAAKRRVEVGPHQSLPEAAPNPCGP